MGKHKNRRRVAPRLQVVDNSTPDEQLPSCCRPVPKRGAPGGQGNQGFLMGLVYGLIPHTFCILFIVLSVLGATAATSVIKRFLYIPYIFQIIVALSFVFATISAAFYLKRNGLLSMPGIKFKWKYLSVMYGTTVGINLLFFTVLFPLVANADFTRPTVNAPALASAQAGSPALSPNAGAVTLQVNIPCPGHAPLIMDELKKLDGITGVRYQFPNSFQVTYDSSKLTVQKILAMEVFKSFPAKTK